MTSQRLEKKTKRSKCNKIISIQWRPLNKCYVLFRVGFPNINEGNKEIKDIDIPK